MEFTHSRVGSQGFVTLAADGTFRMHGVWPGERRIVASSGRDSLGELELTVLASDLTLDVLVPLAKR